MSNELFRNMVRDILDDAKQAKEAGDDLFVEKISHKEISVFDMMDGETEELRYTIRNPEFMTRNWLESKLIITKSARKKKLINENAIVNWLFSYLPKEMYLTLQQLIFVYNDEKDVDELYADERVGELLEIHDLSRQGCLGITWKSECIIVVHLGNILREAVKLLRDGYIYPWEFRDDINNNILATIAHEMRHLAQYNPYLPEEILSQDSDDEDDAENFARDFVENHPAYIIA